MRCVYFLSFLIISVIVNAKGLTRGVKIKFSNGETYLTKENKSIIIDEYLKTGEGDWLYFTTVSVKEIGENRLLAFKNAKVRNREIGKFLKESGVQNEQMKYKYSSFEHVWVNKPSKLESSVSVVNEDQSTTSSVRSFRNIDGYTFELPSGNLIEFKSMSFEGMSQDIITVKIKEYSTKKDFVKYGVTAQGDKGMLETQGMYFVEAYSNEDKVNLRRGMSYKLKIKGGKTSETFSSFYGREKGGELTWVENPTEKFYPTNLNEEIVNTGVEVFEEEVATTPPANNSSGKFGNFYVDADGNLQALTTQQAVKDVYDKVETSNALGNYLVGKFSQLGWINCDRFYSAPETITMKIKIDQGLSEKGYSVYVIFKDINSVLPLYRVTNGAYQTPQIPKGVDATVFAVQANGKEGNRLAFKSIKTTDEKITSLNSQEVGETEVERYMNDVIY